MKLLSTLTFVILIGISYTFSQKKSTIQIKPSVGYSTNLLKSPNSYQPHIDSTEQGISELWKNVPFAQLEIGYIRYLNKSNNLRFKTLVRESFFTDRQSIEARDWQFKMGHSYHGKFIKNTWELGVRNLVRTGSLDFDDLLGAPLSYRRVTLLNKFSLKVSKPWHLNIHPFYELKSYDQENYNRFMYHRFGGEIGANYRYTYKKKVGVSLYGQLHQRFYQLERLSNDQQDLLDSLDYELEEEIWDSLQAFSEHSIRRWNYAKVGFATRIPLGKYGKLIPEINYLIRTDLTEQKFGYHQLGLGLNYSVKWKKNKFELRNSILFRSYSTIQAKNEFGEKSPLRYIYVRPEISYTRSIGKRTSLFVSLDARYRKSSVDPVSSRIFRSYLMTNVRAGVSFKFDQVKKLKKR